MNIGLFSRHAGAERVGGGIYWSHHEAGIVSIPRDGGTLPGQASNHYTRMPLIAVLVIGPILGTAFAFFLPAAGIVGLAQLALGRVSRASAPARVRRERKVELGSQNAEDDPQI